MRSRTAIVAFTALFFGLLPVQGADEEARFFERLLPHARTVSRESGIPVSVILAVAAHESDFDRSYLSQKGYNYFGIKGKGSKGSLRLTTTEYVGGRSVKTKANFAHYADPTEAFQAYARVLSDSRYAAAFHFTDDPDRFIGAVHRGGYATDPKYAAKVSSIIERHDLRRYDRTSWTRGEVADAFAGEIRDLTGRAPAASVDRSADPATHGDAAILLGKALGVKPKVSSQRPYPDVPAGSPAAAYLAALKDWGIYRDATAFEPDRPVASADVRSLVAKLKTLSTTRRSFVEAFVRHQQRQGRLPEGHDPIDLAIARGWLQGDERGIDLDRPITRAEAATTLHRALALTDPGPLGPAIDDTRGHWAEESIRAATRAGLLGAKDGRFDPDRRLLHTDVADILSRLSPPNPSTPAAGTGMTDVIRDIVPRS